MTPEELRHALEVGPVLQAWFMPLAFLASAVAPVFQQWMGGKQAEGQQRRAVAAQQSDREWQAQQRQAERDQYQQLYDQWVDREQQRWDSHVERMTPMWSAAAGGLSKALGVPVGMPMAAGGPPPMAGPAPMMSRGSAAEIMAPPPPVTAPLTGAQPDPGAGSNSMQTALALMRLFGGGAGRSPLPATPVANVPSFLM